MHRGSMAHRNSCARGLKDWSHWANHLLLNPVCRYAEQLEALAEVVGVLRL